MTRDLLSRRIVEAGLRHLEREDIRRATLRPIERGEATPFDVDDPARVAIREARLGRHGDAFGLARLMGESDLLPIAWLERGRLAAKSVARLAVRNRFGVDEGVANGFLIAPRLLLTAWHVLPNAEAASRSLAEFGAEFDAEGRPKSPQIFGLDPDAFFISNEALDVAVVAVSSSSYAGGALDDFGFLSLEPASGKVLLTERLTLIDHPRGLGKHVGLRTAKLIDVFGDYFHYAADFAPASSGAPVFSDQWDLVAMHHTGLPRMDAKRRLLDAHGRGLEAGTEPGWIGGEGIRVSRICDFLSSLQASSDLEAELLAGFRISPSAEVPLIELIEAEPEVVEVPVVDILEIEDAVEVPVVELPEIEDAVELPEVELVEADVVEVPEVQVAALSEVDYEPEDADGYDSDFLGEDHSVFMPLLPPEWSHQLLRDNAGSSELPLRRYSVAFDQTARRPLVVGAHLDGHTWEMPDDEDGPLLADVRFERSVQPSLDALNHPFLYRLPLLDAKTICCGFGAQASGREANHLMNQVLVPKRDGLGLWSMISLHWVKWVVGEQSRATVYAGPIVSPGEDLEHEGVVTCGELWKVVAWVENDELKSVGYLLTTRNVLRDLEAAPGTWRAYRVAVAHLEELTGLDFGRLRRADALFESPIEHRPIRSKADLLEPGDL